MCLGRTFTRVLDCFGEASLVPGRWSSLGTVQERDAVLRVPLLRSRGLAAEGHPYEEEKRSGTHTHHGGPSREHDHMTVTTSCSAIRKHHHQIDAFSHTMSSVLRRGGAIDLDEVDAVLLRAKRAVAESSGAPVGYGTSARYRLGRLRGRRCGLQRQLQWQCPGPRRPQPLQRQRQRARQLVAEPAQFPFRANTVVALLLRRHCGPSLFSRLFPFSFGWRGSS